MATEAEGLRLHLSSSSSSGYKGVNKQASGRFEAKHRVGGKVVYLGTFGTAVEAAVAYARAFGEAAAQSKGTKRPRDASLAPGGLTASSRGVPGSAELEGGGSSREWQSVGPYVGRRLLRRLEGHGDVHAAVRLYLPEVRSAEIRRDSPRYGLLARGRKRHTRPC